MQLLLDNNYLTNLIDVAATGGWQNWQTQQVENIQLTEGKHDLSIRFYFGGFNFSSMEFELTTVDVKNTEGSKIEFNLEQNYPNPFNPTTVIKYGLAENSFAKIEIFNVLGQKVAVLANENKSAGNHQTIWDAQNLPSGIYFISINAKSLNSNKNFKQVKKALLVR